MKLKDLSPLSIHSVYHILAHSAGKGIFFAHQYFQKFAPYARKPYNDDCMCGRGRVVGKRNNPWLRFCVKFKKITFPNNFLQIRPWFFSSF